LEKNNFERARKKGPLVFLKWTSLRREDFVRKGTEVREGRRIKS